MTNEEAIKIIDDECEHIKQHLTENGKAEDFYIELGNMVIAYKMASKALARELCDDVISRQVVKDKYRERLVNSLKDDDREIDLSKYAEEPYKVFCDFMDSISPVNLQDSKWIPVSERLPEEREWIGTKRFGTTKSDEVYVTLETPDGERFTEHLFFQNGGLSLTDRERMRVWFNGAVPIAWMPLPKAYEPQERSVKE